MYKNVKREKTNKIVDAAIVAGADDDISHNSPFTVTSLDDTKSTFSITKWGSPVSPV